MSRVRASVVLLLAGLLVACSSMPYAQRRQQRMAAYRAAAGAPVHSFRFVGTMWSWEPLGDTELVVYTRPDRAWLIDVGASCPNLPFANVIGLTSSFDEVSVGFDRVLTGRGYIPCTISRIRPLDVAKLKIEQAKQREVEVEPRKPAGG